MRLAFLQNVKKSTNLPLLSCVLLLVSVSAIECVRASPCVDPKRMVSGHTVNLSPLIEWWSEPKSVRPLPAWKHVRGSIAQETAFGWMINGKAEGQSTDRFLLKNPPRERLRRFRELQPRLAEYEKNRAATMETLGRPVYSWWDSFWGKPPLPQSISPEEYRLASAHLAELDRNIRATRDELAPMQDEHGNFKLDAFALHVNESYQGLPVFDHGLVQPFR